jgi:hypothetical protein
MMGNSRWREFEEHVEQNKLRAWHPKCKCWSQKVSTKTRKRADYYCIVCLSGE